MPIFDIFSKRQKKLRGELPDVYSYDSLPDPLKVQVVHIVHGALGNAEEYHSPPYPENRVKHAYRFIVRALCREYGMFQLPGTDRNYGERIYLVELVEFFLQEQDIDRTLDVVELCFHTIDKDTRHFGYLRRGNPSAIADDAIRELNYRFREHGVGYWFENERIIRIDSQLMHSEVVKPALMLLGRSQYAGAQQEFLQAHEHYRASKTKEALNECLKSFESMMKSVCDQKGWSYDQNATAKRLIDICFDNGLVPAFWKQHFSSLRSVLESGVPTGRNRLGGHGQGAVPTPVPMHLVGYMLHMTAAAILFLAEAADNGNGK